MAARLSAKTIWSVSAADKPAAGGRAGGQIHLHGTEGSSEGLAIHHSSARARILAGRAPGSSLQRSAPCDSKLGQGRKVAARGSVCVWPTPLAPKRAPRVAAGAEWPRAKSNLWGRLIGLGTLETRSNWFALPLALTCNRPADDWSRTDCTPLALRPTVASPRVHSTNAHSLANKNDWSFIAVSVLAIVCNSSCASQERHPFPSRASAPPPTRSH